MSIYERKKVCKIIYQDIVGLNVGVNNVTFPQ